MTPWPPSNRFRGEVGRPFQGRYKAIHVEPGHALARVAHYIHLNPVHAGIVSARDLLEYRWSSLPMLAKCVRVPWLGSATLLAEGGGLANTPAGWRSYIDYLDLLAEMNPAKRDAKFGSLSRGWAIGSTGVTEELRKTLAVSAPGRERFEILGADRGAYRQARQELWEEKLCALAAAFSVDLPRLPPPKSAPPKVLRAAAIKSITPVSHRWLAQRLQLGKPSSVGALLLRSRRSGGGDTPGTSNSSRPRTAFFTLNAHAAPYPTPANCRCSDYTPATAQHPRSRPAQVISRQNPPGRARRDTGVPSAADSNVVAPQRRNEKGRMAPALRVG